ncbi:unnamed protein product [Durusdinium trenchii]|uniref:Uncharacterized protein n=1 Tax=Durusdinium trenchii TaxID=1381693 RepID=A0ABP0RRK0_9DINO
MTMSEPPTKESFSYAVPCVEFWESQRGLCKLAVQRKSLVKEAEGKAIVHPSLPNLRLNYLLLKGYTKTMKEKGVILTKHMTYILPAISDFYESMDPELDTKLDGPRTVIYGTALEAFEELAGLASQDAEAMGDDESKGAGRDALSSTAASSAKIDPKAISALLTMESGFVSREDQLKLQQKVDKKKEAKEKGESEENQKKTKEAKEKETKTKKKRNDDEDQEPMEEEPEGKRVAPKKKPKDKDGPQKKAGEKATFAKRYRPTSKQNSLKFDRIRDVYNVDLRKYLTGHTWYMPTNVLAIHSLGDAQELLSVTDMLIRDWDFCFIEHYAGYGQLTNVMREEHGPSARLDLAYHRGHDLLTPAGFA